MYHGNIITEKRKIMEKTLKKTVNKNEEADKNLTEEEKKLREEQRKRAARKKRKKRMIRYFLK